MVVFPTTAEDVAATVLFSKVHNLDLAVAGGGHSTSGSSSTNGGVCIDLSKMRKATVDQAKKTITAQGGCIWEDVDLGAAEHGLATVGGTVNHTGVGGLTLGGGYGWLTPAYGLTIDNLLAVELVLADGRIVVTSEAENPDLFWAVRGAGACFGVATSFVFQGYEQKNAVWGGLTVFAPDKLPDIVNFANQVLEVSKGESAMVFGFGAPKAVGKPVVLAILFYNGPVEHAEEFYGPLLKLGPILNKTASMPYSSVNAMLNSVSTHGDRKSQKGTAFLPPLDPKFASSIFQDFKAFVEENPDASKTIVLFEFFSPRVLMKLPQEATSFANRGLFGNILLGMRWTEAANDLKCRGWAREMSTKISTEFEHNRQLNSSPDAKDGVGEYGNYDSESFCIDTQSSTC